MLQPYVLGVDGGGTKTVACVAQRQSAGLVECGRGSAGSSNLVAADSAAALEELGRAIREACSQAQCAVGQLDAACLALAGSDRPVVREQIQLWAQGMGLHRVQLVHDAAPILAAGTPGNWGIALISGTGSFAFGRDVQGQVARAGGWGAMLGDEGSGYWLAREALRAVTRQLDGRGPVTALTECLLAALQVQEPRELPLRVAAMSRGQLAALAPQVVALADRGDAVARELTESAAGELAKLVMCLAERLGWTSHEFPLALSGGLLLNHPQFVGQLQLGLERHAVVPSAIQLVSDPVQGALVLASS